MRLAALAVFLLIGAGCGGGGGGGDEGGDTNVRPLANAGLDQSVATGSLVSLDGSGSSDADGDTLTYAWSLTSTPGGSTATLSSATAAAPTFNVDVEGTYVLSLTVDDGMLTSSADAVKVEVVVAAHVPDTGQEVSPPIRPPSARTTATAP